MTVRDLQQEYETLEGYPAEEQRWIFRGRVLELNEKVVEVKGLIINDKEKTLYESDPNQYDIKWKYRQVYMLRV